MALQKEKTLSNRTTGNYWKITDIRIDRLNLSAFFTLSLFTNKSDCDDGADSLGLIRTFNSDYSKDDLCGNLAILGYTLIKKDLDFNDAIDI